MAIELISKIKPKNNGNFKLVDAQDVEYNGKGLDEAIASGEFKGDKGDRGDIGPMGPTGPTGPNGDNGNDGFSPTVSVAEDVDGVTVTVQNKDGAQTAKVKNGKDGKDYEHSEEFTTLAEQVRADKESVEQSKTSVEQTVAQAEGKIDTAGTIAIRGVQNEGTTQTEKVTVEGTKQITEIQSKGEEILHSFPQDFPTQMATKLDKQQGVENVGKTVVVGEDGNLVVGEVQSSGDDLIIVNTASGESPLAISDSTGRKIKGFRMTGKTEQVTTSGVNLFDEKLLLDFDSENYDKTQSRNGIYYYKFPVNGTVTVSTKNTNKNGEYLTVGIKPDGSDKTWLSHGSAAISKYKTLTPEDGNIYLGVNNNLERVKSMIQNTGGIIINKGSTAAPYEPYTGGKPSPSPEYPQEIVNAGKWNEEKQKYEVTVEKFGKNLFNKSIALPLSSYDVKTGSYWRKYFYLFPNTKYRIRILNNSGNPVQPNSTVFIGPASPEYNYDSEHANGLTVLFPTDAKEKNYIFSTDETGKMVLKAIGYANETNIQKNLDNIDIMIYEHSLDDKIEQYIEPKTISLASDRPITKWDKLVEQDGQIGWLYATKKHMVTGSEHFLNGGENYYTGSSVDLYFNVMDATGSQGIVKNLSYVPSIWHDKDAEGFNVNGSQFHIRLKNTRLSVSDDATKDEKIAAYKTYLAGEHEKGTPYEIVYQSLETEFVPLPQEEQDAIRAMTTYYPSTTLINDQGCTMELDYVADPKNFILGQIGNLQKSLVNTQVQLL